MVSNTIEDGHSQELLDLKTGGKLVFCASCDHKKIKALCTEGIKPRGGSDRSASYFPNVVSLIPLEPKGYGPSTADVIFVTVRHNSSWFENLDYPNYDFAFIIDPSWVKGHREEFVATGGQYKNTFMVERYLTGTLEGIKVKPLERTTFNEVHFEGGILPPYTLKGIVNDQRTSGEVHEQAQTMLMAVLAEIQGENRQLLNLPLGIYRETGDLVGRFG